MRRATSPFGPYALYSTPGRRRLSVVDHGVSAEEAGCELPYGLLMEDCDLTSSVVYGFLDCLFQEDSTVSFVDVAGSPERWGGT